VVDSRIRQKEQRHTEVMQSKWWKHETHIYIEYKTAVEIHLLC
jgi:hypothetical protein